MFNLQKATWLVLLKDDQWFTTDKQIHPVELCVELVKLGVNWKDIALVLRLPSQEPIRV